MRGVLLLLYDQCKVVPYSTPEVLYFHETGSTEFPSIGFGHAESSQFSTSIAGLSSSMLSTRIVSSPGKALAGTELIRSRTGGSRRARDVVVCSGRSSFHESRRDLLVSITSLAAVSVLPKGKQAFRSSLSSWLIFSFTDKHVLPAVAEASLDSIYELSALQYGEETSFSQFKNQVTVIVNVASE